MNLFKYDKGLKVVLLISSCSKSLLRSTKCSDLGSFIS